MASIVLVVLGAVLLFAGAVSLYAREQVIDREAFVDRADEALGTTTCASSSRARSSST